VPAAKVRLAGGAGQEFENKLGFELGGKGTSLTTWHGPAPGAHHNLLSFEVTVTLFYDGSAQRLVEAVVDGWWE